MVARRLDFGLQTQPQKYNISVHHLLLRDGIPTHLGFGGVCFYIPSGHLLPNCSGLERGERFAHKIVPSGTVRTGCTVQYIHTYSKVLDRPIHTLATEHGRPPRWTCCSYPYATCQQNKTRTSEQPQHRFQRAAEAVTRKQDA